MSEELLTTNELAEKLKVHPHTVRLWAKEKKIPYVKLSERDFRYYYSKVIAALEVK